MVGERRRCTPLLPGRGGSWSSPRPGRLFRRPLALSHRICGCGKRFSDRARPLRTFREKLDGENGYRVTGKLAVAGRQEAMLEPRRTSSGKRGALAPEVHDQNVARTPICAANGSPTVVPGPKKSPNAPAGLRSWFRLVIGINFCGVHAA